MKVLSLSLVVSCAFAVGCSSSDSTAPAQPQAETGTAAECLQGTDVETFFTINDATKCVVGRYDVATGNVGSLTWGRHGGPLGFESGAMPTLVRYQVPSTAKGTLTMQKTPVSGATAPEGAFWGSQAVDLPVLNTTAISYTGTGAGFPGEVFLVGEAGVVAKHHVNGFFSATAVVAGRVIHTSTSPVMAAAAATNEGALYAADACAAKKGLLPDGDASCKAPVKIATWQKGASGPVASDPAQNVFAILSTFGGKQELRAFEKSTVAPGGGPTEGTTLFSDDYYTGDLTADGKTVYWQPNDAMTFSALDVMSLGYEAASAKVTAKGAPAVFLKMKTAGTKVTLLVDEKGRLWVGVAGAAMGDAGPTSSVMFLLRDKSS